MTGLVVMWERLASGVLPTEKPERKVLTRFVDWSILV